MIQIVIPMAGLGSRFSKAGYKMPKPFIDVAGWPMISRVAQNLTPMEPYKFIFIAREEHRALIKEHMSFARDVVYVNELTEGAACTVLLAKGLLDLNEPLVIANSDQLVEWNVSEIASSVDSDGPELYWRESNSLQDMINNCRISKCDAAIASFEANHPKWSYALLDDDDQTVVRVAEKEVISNVATVGVYYFETAELFTRAAERMIEKNIRVNGEFYVCPVFNEIVGSHRVCTYGVEEMYGLGTPEDLELFLNEHAHDVIF